MSSSSGSAKTSPQSGFSAAIAGIFPFFGAVISILLAFYLRGQEGTVTESLKRLIVGSACSG
jgi:hypothetical protein